MRGRYGPCRLSPTESDVLNECFLMAREGRLEAFYAPLHGVTANAQVVIVGLTPGLSQMVLAFQGSPDTPRPGLAPAAALRRDPAADIVRGTHAQ